MFIYIETVGIYCRDKLALQALATLLQMDTQGNMISAQGLLRLCQNIVLKGLDDSANQHALGSLEVKLGDVYAKREVRRVDSINTALSSAGSLARGLMVLLAHATRLTLDLYGSWSILSGEDSRTGAVFCQQQQEMAGIYMFMPALLDSIVEGDDKYKLAVATAATETGFLQALHTLCDKFSADLVSEDFKKSINTHSRSMMLAMGIVNMWRSFVTHWPARGRVLVDKHLTLLAQPVATLLYWELHFVNENLSKYATSSNGASELVTVSKAGCVGLARCISQETAAATEPFGQGPDSKLRLLQPESGPNLQSLIAMPQILQMFSLGAATCILDMQNQYTSKQQASNVGRRSLPRSTHVVPTQVPQAFKDLLQALQLNALDAGLFTAACASKPRGVLASLPITKDAACSILKAIIQVFNALSKPAMLEWYLATKFKWLGYAVPLLSLLTDLALGMLNTSIATNAEEGPVSLAVEAMSAILGAQLSAQLMITVAPIPGCSIRDFDEQILSSISAIEQCIRSAVVAKISQSKSLQLALSAVTAIAVGIGYLSMASPALSNSVKSLLLTCFKVARLCSNAQPAQAAAVAQDILAKQLQVLLSNDVVDTLAGVIESLLGRNLKKAFNGLTMQSQSDHLQLVSVLAGHTLFVLGNILQRTSDHEAADQQQAQAKGQSLFWLSAAVANIKAWLDEGDWDSLPAAAIMPRSSLAALHKQLQQLASATSATGLQAQSRNCHSKGGVLAGLGHNVGILVGYGAALSTEFPVPYGCNNPSCVNMSRESELLLVSGKGSVCSACHKARYCSKECQQMHWKQHKVVCRRLRSAAAN